MALTNFPNGVSSFGTPILNDVAIGIVGQSNEQNRVNPSDKSAYPQAFGSLRNPYFNGLIDGQIIPGNGGFWYKVYDDLFDKGVRAQFFNGAVGSASFISHACGQVFTRANSTGVAARRTPDDSEDRGYFGTITVQGGKVFVSTTGKKQILFRRRNINGATSWAESGIDYVSTSGTGTTASSDPGGWSSATVGSTITDGSVTWTCVEGGNSTGMANGQILSPTFQAYGFDPFGMLERVHIGMKGIRATRKIIYIQNAQSDAGNSAVNYQAALENIGTFFLLRGYEIMIGLSCYNPNSSTTLYDNLQTGRASALTTLKAAYPGKVYDGANLYSALGTTGNMAIGGGYLQDESGAWVHLNGAGALAGASYISSSFISALGV